jgi:hypothetical protein
VVMPEHIHLLVSEPARPALDRHPVAEAGPGQAGPPPGDGAGGTGAALAEALL